jgi:hypothetical protein
MPSVRALFVISSLLAAATLGCADEEAASSRGVSLVADSEELREYQKGRGWAVVIGVDDYASAPRLRYAVADARAVGGELERQGFDVTYLLDGEATGPAILGAIGDDLPQKVSAADRVVIFFAGHGQTRKFEGGSETGFLMPVEASFEKLRQTAIDMGAVKSLADELPAKHVLFLIDACYGGIAGLRGRAANPKVDDAYLRAITRDRGRQLITAGGPDEEAHESPEWGHSAFTHVLLKGLRDGLADINSDGIVPASELHQFLERNVFEAVQVSQTGGRGDAVAAREQRPQFWQLGADRGEFVFFPSGGSQRQDLAATDDITADRPPGFSENPLEGSADGASLIEPADESAQLAGQIEQLSAQQQAISAVLDEMHAQAQGAIQQIRADDEPPTRPHEVAVTRPQLPAKSWTCNAFKVVVNGKTVKGGDYFKLMMVNGGNAPDPGCYWYDPKSGMWGYEGQPSAGSLQENMDIGGPLRADASGGDTLVFLNGRELTRIEAQSLAALGGPTRAGFYWMNGQGVGGVEGQSASFNLAAAAQAMAAQQAQQGQSGDAGANSGGSNDSYYQSGDTHGGVQGDCVYMSGSDFSYIGEGCD